MTLEDFDDPFSIFVDELGRLGLENTSGCRRYYSIYLAQCVGVDPGEQGMVRVVVRATGQSKPLPLLARPSSPFAGPDYGFYTPPENGDVGWVAFDHGDKTARPRWIGSFWKNPKKDGNPSNSEVPAEFKTGGDPEIRGFKTPRGSGWRISDQEAQPFLEAWTGEQTTEGAAAEQHHVFRMSDEPGLERVSINTFLGHQLALIDNPAGERGILLQSILGSRLFFDDTNQRLSLATPSGHAITMDELSLKMTIETLGELDITSQKQLRVFSGGPTEFQMLSTFNMNVAATALWTFLAALTITVTGIMTIASPAGLGLTIAAGVVSVGLIGIGVFRFVIEPFLAIYNANVAIHNSNVGLYNAHFHPFVSPGPGTPSFTGPTVPTTVGQSPVATVNPDLVTSQNIRGN